MKTNDEESSTMKRLMVVGGSVLQLPAIQKAKELGLCVGVVDINPKALCRQYADYFYPVSTVDAEDVCCATETFHADGIMTLATDMPMRSIAYTAQKLGLCGISQETALKATDKAEMIKAFDASGVAHPWYYIVKTEDDLTSIFDNINYPCISKPVDNAGSRGVVLVQNRRELHKAFEYSSQNGRSGNVIIEEYLQGNEVSVEIMTIAGNVHVLQVTDKLTTGAPHFVEMGHSQPSQMDKRSIEDIKKLACAAVKAVGIENGPAHVEIMLTKDGPKMIELGARMGGDCITSHLVPLSTGIDMVKATIQIALGEKPMVEPCFQRGAAIRYLPEMAGTISSIEGLEQARATEGVQLIVVQKMLGEAVNKIESSVDRIGYVITQADDAAHAIKCCENALLKIKIQTRR